MAEIVLAPSNKQEACKNTLLQEIDNDVAKANEGFDIDDVSDNTVNMLEQAKPLYDLAYLKTVLENPRLRPNDVAVKAMRFDMSYLMPAAKHPIRVTTDASYFEEPAESVEF